MPQRQTYTTTIASGGTVSAPAVPLGAARQIAIYAPAITSGDCYILAGAAPDALRRLHNPNDGALFAWRTGPGSCAVMVGAVVLGAAYLAVECSATQAAPAAFMVELTP